MSNYMTIKFNLYDFLTVKPTKELIGDARFLEIMLHIESSYQYENELKKYMK